MEMIDGDDRVIMKITGPLVNIMMKINPNKYRKCIVYENGKKVIYIVVLTVLYRGWWTVDT